jgi:hypothetical protein
MSTLTLTWVARLSARCHGNLGKQIARFWPPLFGPEIPIRGADISTVGLILYGGTSWLVNYRDLDAAERA